MNETPDNIEVTPATELPLGTSGAVNVSEADLDIPESLRRCPVAAEKLPRVTFRNVDGTEGALEVPVELEREFVSIEEEGGVEVTEKE